MSDVAALTRRGVIRAEGGRCRVELTAERCAGCVGHCGLAFAPPSLTLEGLDAADGQSVELIARTKRMVALALRVFGAPLAVAVGAAGLAETMAWPQWLAPVASLAAMAAMVAPRARRATPPRVTADGDIVRIRIDQ